MEILCFFPGPSAHRNGPAVVWNLKIFNKHFPETVLYWDQEKCTTLPCFSAVHLLKDINHDLFLQSLICKGPHPFSLCCRALVGVTGSSQTGV